MARGLVVEKLGDEVDVQPGCQPEEEKELRVEAEKIVLRGYRAPMLIVGAGAGCAKDIRLNLKASVRDDRSNRRDQGTCEPQRGMRLNFWRHVGMANLCR